MLEININDLKFGRMKNKKNLNKDKKIKGITIKTFILLEIKAYLTCFLIIYVVSYKNN